MDDANHESTDAAECQRPSWLNGLKPASASSLQASVFYQAGYEAARRELRNSTKRRSILAAIAASFLLAVATGAIGFKLGTQNSLTLANSSAELRTQANAIEVSSSLDEQATSPSNLQQNDTLVKTPKDSLAKDQLLQGTSADNDGEQNPFTNWWQTGFRRMFPNSHIPLLGNGFQLGPIDAELDQIIVFTSAPRTDAKPVQLNKPPDLPEQRTFKELRESQIKSLMDALL
jgi:hypothetical protein